MLCADVVCDAMYNSPSVPCVNQEAVLELKRLAKLCPNEPKIFLQIGKVNPYLEICKISN